MPHSNRTSAASPSARTPARRVPYDVRATRETKRANARRPRASRALRSLDMNFLPQSQLPGFSLSSEAEVIDISDSDDDESGPSEGYHAGIYVVQRIMARSPTRVRGEDGEHEYRYLIRWQGYGPEEDTWEMRSNIAENAEALIDYFEQREHPHRILASKKEGSTSRYLVRYGFQGTTAPASPLAEMVWHTEAQMKRRGVRDPIQAIKDFKRGQEGGRGPKLVEESQQGDKEVQKEDDSPRLWRLIDIVDRYTFKPKYNSPNVLVRWLCRYTASGYTLEEWYDRSTMNKLFGAEIVGQRMDVWAGTDPASLEAAAKAALFVSDYEAERRSRMKENQDLMKDLGL